MMMMMITILLIFIHFDNHENNVAYLLLVNLGGQSDNPLVLDPIGALVVVS